MAMRRCSKCGRKAGHNAATCTSRKRAKKKKKKTIRRTIKKKSTRRCSKCNRTGHNAATCTNRRKKTKRASTTRARVTKKKTTKKKTTRRRRSSAEPRAYRTRADFFSAFLPKKYRDKLESKDFALLDFGDHNGRKLMFVVWADSGADARGRGTAIMGREPLNRSVSLGGNLSTARWVAAIGMHENSTLLYQVIDGRKQSPIPLNYSNYWPTWLDYAPSTKPRSVASRGEGAAPISHNLYTAEGVPTAGRWAEPASDKQVNYMHSLINKLPEGSTNAAFDEIMGGDWDGELTDLSKGEASKLIGKLKSIAYQNRRSRGRRRMYEQEEMWEE